MKQRIMINALQRLMVPMALLLWSAQGLADSAYLLTVAASEVGVTSTKNGRISERHQLKFVEGSVSSTGQVRLVINLLGIQTNIPIRNERMQKHLFAENPLAVVSAQLSPDLFDKAQAGEAMSETIAVTLAANGTSQDLSMMMRLDRAPDGGVTVTGNTVIDVTHLGYGPGIETLRSVAGLLDISTRVPVDFVAHFDD